jgi:hypothetical protein
MNFEDLKHKYTKRNPAFPTDWPIPNDGDLKEIIRNYNCRFSKSYIDFQLKYCLEVSMGDRAWDGFGWANKNLETYLNLEVIVKGAKEMGVPGFLTPFKEDNSDFWCFDNRKEINGEFPVVIWDHNSKNIEADSNYKWGDFIEWLDSTMEEA